MSQLPAKLHKLSETTWVVQAKHTGWAARENFPNRSIIATVAWPGHVKHACKNRKCQREATGSRVIIASSDCVLGQLTMLIRLEGAATENAEAQMQPDREELPESAVGFINKSCDRCQHRNETVSILRKG